MDKFNIKTLQDLVWASAAEYGDKVFLKEKHGNDICEKSFRRFCEDVKRMAVFVSSKRSDNGKSFHAAVIGGSSYAWLVSYFGTVCGGNAAVPLDAQLGCEDIAELLNRSDSEIFFYDSRYEKMIPELRRMCPDVKIYVSFGEDFQDILAENEPEELPEVSPQMLAAISYTSGTTGKSKGVMLLHSNLIDNAMCQDNESTPDDVVLSVLPYIIFTALPAIYCVL